MAENRERDEYQIALDILLKFEEKFREIGIPEERYVMLMNRAHSLVFSRGNLEKILEIVGSLCDIR